MQVDDKHILIVAHYWYMHIPMGPVMPIVGYILTITNPMCNGKCR